MYNLVVIEDEEIIRKGLIYSYNWIDLGFNVIGEAKDGREGIEIIREKSPDVIMLDLNLPIVNGMSLLEETSEYDYETIIISGYYEFEYAKKAIDFNVSSYLLKPIDDKELYDALDKVKIKLDKKSNYIREYKDLYKLIDELGIKNIKNNYEKYNESTLKIISYVSKNYKNKISIDDLIKKTNRGKTYICENFKNDTNLSINKFINRYRIMEAIKLLKNTDYGIEDIAYDVGFSEYRYFIKVFRDHMNISPSRFRKLYFSD